jgi:anthranilate synthase component 1
MRSRLPEWVDPEIAYSRLRAANAGEHTVWLDAGPDATTGLSYLSLPNGRMLSDSSVVDEATGSDIFTALRSSLAHDADIDTAQARDDGFSLGWVGWFGYELAALTTGIPVSDAPTDDARFVYVDWALEYDHAARTIDLLALVDTENEWEEMKSSISTALAASSHETETPVPERSGARWRFGAAEYTLLVQRCLDRIRAGDAYQLCLTNSATIAGSHNAVAVYRRLRRENPSHHGGLLVFGDTALLSSSPEVFLRVTPEGLVTTKPIKGTRPRGLGEADAALAKELQANDKERAENLMIVDLMRNDLGRVAELGTVSVDALLEVETYPHVHQLVSTVSAQLASGLTALDAIEACFPAGSMTGAPKISAMRILHELEQGPRGIYSGVFGYLGINGAADLAMVIRSIVVTENQATIGTGGGITSGSLPQAEYEEMLLKAEPLLRALNAGSAS